MELPVLDLSGRAQAMGEAHGAAFRDAIRAFARERTEKLGEAFWVGRDLSRDEVLAIAESCLEQHKYYAPALFEEMHGMGRAAGLSDAEMLVVSGFTDLIDTVFNSENEPVATPAPAEVDNCTAVLVPRSRSAGRNALFAQTWDMHESATEHVVVLRGRPANAPAFTVFTSMGCMGMIGMNDAGITIGINNLTGADGQAGVSWNFIVREVLGQRDFDAALACITDVKRAGAHNYLLLDGEGRGANIEATATADVVTPLAEDCLMHTNHCVGERTVARERPRQPVSQAESEKRLARAHEWFDEAEAVDMDSLAAFTRDTQAICYPPTPQSRMTTCGAVVADPANRTLWALRGRPSEQQYQAFRLAAN